jgi:hypothetical protein
LIKAKQEVYGKGWVEMDRRLLVLIVAVVALIGVVNATAFAYRWMTGNITISDASSARGIACTGFYSSADPDQSGIDLPEVGTNYNAPTYGGNTISVTPGDSVCEWTVGSSTYKLHESITVDIPVTVGSWYIKDFYGFGYHGSTDDPSTVYVTFKLEEPVSDITAISNAYLIIKSSDGSTEIGRLDLVSGTTIGPFSLSRNSAWRLDLRFNATSTSTDPVSFTVGVYVSLSSTESP